MTITKSVLIKGRLKNLQYQLCPNTEFSSGLWSMSLSSIYYECKDQNVTTLCSVSSNFVRSQGYSANNSINTYEQPMTLFLLESGKKCFEPCIILKYIN